jgi:hypothetical protein
MPEEIKKAKGTKSKKVEKVEQEVTETKVEEIPTTTHLTENVSETAVKEPVSETEDTETDHIFKDFNIEEFNQDLDKVSELLEKISKVKKLPTNKKVLKDIDSKYHKIQKYSSIINKNLSDFYLGQYKEEKPKKEKKAKDPNYIPYVSSTDISIYPEVLQILELDADAKLSKNDINKFLNSLLKEEKDNNNLIEPVEVINGKKCPKYKVTGAKLSKLMTFYKKIDTERNGKTELGNSLCNKEMFKLTSLSVIKEAKELKETK